MPFERPFPVQFRLKNLTTVTARGFALKVNPNSAQANQAMRTWFRSFKVYNEEKQLTFLQCGKFELFAALSFPEADLKHLKTCLAFFFWAFSTDDLSDEGALQSNPGAVQASINISNLILYDQAAPRPTYPYAAMLYDLLKEIRKTASAGAATRFTRAFEEWSRSQVKQSHNRSIKRMPSVAEFILMRRATIGAAMVEAMVEYSLDIDLPAHVFEDKIIRRMSDATNDIMTWPNDLCSFNKEQADGDYQNLVCCIMVERNVDLQEAVDILTRMVDERVSEYLYLKSQLPSFGPEIDKELARYLTALEYFVQGTVVWYYRSPRYFSGTYVDEELKHAELEITLYQPISQQSTILKVAGTGKRLARLSTVVIYLLFVFLLIHTQWNAQLPIARFSSIRNHFSLSPDS